jgi:hypothetical protein
MLENQKMLSQNEDGTYSPACFVLLFTLSGCAKELWTLALHWIQDGQLINIHLFYCSPCNRIE